jgi:signal transduction histidine kinase
MALSPEILVPRLGEVLVSEGLITNEQLNLALEKQKKVTTSKNPVRIGEILVEQGYLSREDLDQAITRQILRFQQALVASNRTLEERVRDRTSELEAAYKRLSELDVIKSNFISNISHELRTPLTHLKGYIDLLMTTDGIEGDPELRSALEVMQRSAERLENLINDLIMFSIAENGQLQISNEKFNLKEMALIVLSRHQKRAENKQICLELDCPSDDFYVYADKNRITWVINQLVDNAIKFMNNGESNRAPVDIGKPCNYRGTG